MRKIILALAVVTFLIASLIGSFISSWGIVHAASNAVYLKSSSETSSVINLGQTNTLSALFANNSTDSKTVLVDIEIYDTNWNKVAQKYYDNVQIAGMGSVAESMDSPSSLPTGDYHWSVGMFNPGWNGLTSWYSNTQSFHIGNDVNKGDVVLDSSALGEFHYNDCPKLTALLRTTSVPQSVLVDIELRNSQGVLFDQYAADNTFVQSNNLTSVMNTCSTKLPADTYSYSVGIFNPHWNGLLHWYQNIQKFTVSPIQQNGDVTLSKSSETLGTLNQGQQTTFTATILNSNPSDTSIILDTEIYNNNWTKVYQEYNTVTVPANGMASHTVVSPPTLPTGTYHWSVGLFTPNWQNQIHWYSGVQNFIVNATQTPTIQVVQVNRPKFNPAAASSFTVTPEIISPNQTLTNLNVEVSLTDQNNIKRYDITYSNQTLMAGTGANFALPVTSAETGTYTIGVNVQQIMNQSTTTIQSFNNLGTIVVQ